FSFTARAPPPLHTLSLHDALPISAMPREAQLRELSRRMQAELNLAPEQRNSIETIVRDSQERMKAVRDEVGKKVGEEFREMLHKDRKSTRLNSSHLGISYAVFCLK